MRLLNTLRAGRRGRAVVLALLMMTTLWVGGGTVLAQGVDGDPIVLVNRDGQVVERKKDGKFIARPIFDRRIEVLAYGVRDADTGDWIGGVTSVNDRGERLSEGWEYSWEYPGHEDQPDLDPESTYVLFMVVSETSPGTSYEFYVVVPIYESDSLWDRVVAALNPTRWAKAVATWVVQGVHGTLCAVVEKAASTDAEHCEAGS